MNYVLEVGNRFVADAGQMERVYPWAPGKPSRTTCYLTEAEWFLDDLRHGGESGRPAARQSPLTRSDGEILHRRDLRIDFIPLIHIGNTVSDGEHFGQSSLAKVMQALDELAKTDTDSARASATTGAPIIELAEARAEVDCVTGCLDRSRSSRGRSSSSPAAAEWMHSTLQDNSLNSAPAWRRSATGPRSRLDFLQ